MDFNSNKFCKKQTKKQQQTPLNEICFDYLIVFRQFKSRNKKPRFDGKYMNSDLEQVLCSVELNMM